MTGTGNCLLLSAAHSRYTARVNLCRFTSSTHPFPRVGLHLPSQPNQVLDLFSVGVERLTPLLEVPNPREHLQALIRKPIRRIPLEEVRLLSPIEDQEVWAAGVTYQRSKTARMEESDFSASAYDRVYDAPRPEIFFKSLGYKAVGPNQGVGIRSDAQWNVPEPELALVLNSRGELVGCTIGNDMSSRDIEGENLLYLPQAKTYHKACALGPWITLESDEATLRSWTISLAILRERTAVFTGETSYSNLKRSIEELLGYLKRCQEFPKGAVLLTGTGIVPPNDFTLAAGDLVAIQISGIGTLSNTVEIV